MKAQIRDRTTPFRGLLQRSKQEMWRSEGSNQGSGEWSHGKKNKNKNLAVKMQGLVTWRTDCEVWG